MKVIKGRNVNGLYAVGHDYLTSYGEEGTSRAGSVLVSPKPVTSVYLQPRERVLFDAVRNANPFFHMMEGLWMLAGRSDAKFLNHYVRDFGKNFAEDGLYIHGAYGDRWRSAFGFDQLTEIVDKLRKNPDDRQCVLQMWDSRPGAQHDAGCDDLMGEWKDRPCNTQAFFRVRKEHTFRFRGGESTYDDKLDMTICCRSNDIVWGAYGANAVHFSMLQEYMAGRIGVDVGTLYQVSNNYHGYTAVLDALGDPMLQESDLYTSGEVHALDMGTDWGRWDEDLKHFMKWHDDILWAEGHVSFGTSFFNEWFTQVPMRAAISNWCHRRGDKEKALDFASRIAASDWRTACTQWLQRRYDGSNGK
jgi:thymidylate synthase